MIKNAIRAGLVTAILAGTATAFGGENDPVRMTVSPAFMIDGGSPYVYPCWITLTNTGPAATGDVSGGSSEHRTVTPFSLAQGEKKTILFVPSYDNYRNPREDIDMEAVSQGKQGDPPIRSSDSYSPPHPAGASANFVYIGNNGSQTRYLTKGNPEPKKGGTATGEPGNKYLGVSTCRPKYAPARRLAYDGIDAVLIGPGSSSIDDSAVEAIKEFALDGRRVVLSEGVAKEDHRWLQSSKVKNGIVDFGQGAIVVSGISLLTSDSDDLHRRDEVCFDAIPPQLQPTAYGYPTGTTGDQPQNPTGLPSTALPHEAKDAFADSLPPLGQILLVIGSYFLAVVPLNFFVLRKLKRPELMWFTAPVLGIAFAGGLFGGSKRIGDNAICQETAGTLVIQSGFERGSYQGQMEIFFPHAGVENLAVPNADQIKEVDHDNGQGVQGLGSDRISVVDTGVQNIPQFQAKNLAFKSFTARELVNTAGWFSFDVGKPKDGLIEVRVTNHSPYTIENPKLFAGSNSNDETVLLPGASMTVPALAKPVIPVGRPIQGPGLAGLAGGPPPGAYVAGPGGGPPVGSFGSPAQSTTNPTRIYLEGNIDSKKFGPKIGRDVSGPASSSIMAYAATTLDSNP